MAVPLAGGHHSARAPLGVLHMDVGHVGFQQLIGGQGLLAHLDKVGKVEHGLEMRTVEGIHQFFAARGVVPVDIFLVLVEQHAVPSFGLFHHAAQPVQHFLPEVRRVLILGNIKAEHAHVRRPQFLLNLQGAFQLVQVGGKVLLNADLSKGRADGGDGNPRCLQLGFYLPHFFGGEVRDVYAVGSPQLQMGNAPLLEGGQL